VFSARSYAIDQATTSRLAACVTKSGSREGRVHGNTEEPLFGVVGEQARLQWFCGGLAARDADDAEDGEFGKSAARNEDAVGTRVEIGRSQLQAVVVNGEEVVRNNAFEAVAITEAQADPQAVEFGTTEKGFAFEGDVVVQIADEIDGADLHEGDFFMSAFGSEEV
jgi:hypothetical protein